MVCPSLQLLLLSFCSPLLPSSSFLHSVDECMDVFRMSGSSEHDSCSVCDSESLDRAVQEAGDSWVGM